jgi:Nickel responsive protein SCO4226-like
MPKYIIERNIPGAGSLSHDQLAAITQVSCGVLKNMGPQIQWLESFVTDDKVYCVYIAPDEATIREHARQGQFPADSVQAVRTIIDPTYGTTQAV